MAELIPPDYSKYDQDNYAKRVLTPSLNREFFTKCLYPTIVEVLAQKGKAVVLNLGIGPGHEFNHPEILDNSNIQVIGLDIDHQTLRKHTRQRLPQALLVAADTKYSPFNEEEEFADCGFAVNALIFNPKEALAMLFKSLKPGGKAIINTVVFDKIRPERVANQLANGCKNFPVEVEIGGQKLSFTAIDYANYNGMETRNLGTQIYPTTRDDARNMLTLSGFEMLGVEPFEYEKNGKKGKTPVFVVQKPAQLNQSSSQTTQ